MFPECFLMRNETSIKSSGTKTLGKRAAQLLTALYERGRPTFTLADVRDITGLNPGSARTLVHKARARGLITRLKAGRYNLVPYELGRATEFVADPYLIARDVVEGAPYFLSHATAFEIHRLTTRPNLEIFVSSPRRFRRQTIGGYRFHFVLVPAARFFGATSQWVTKEHCVAVSDLERSVIDGLRLPQYVGGITEVATGLWMRRAEFDVPRCLDYARRLGVAAVRSRLGFLLERYSLADDASLRSLRAEPASAYNRLDPTLPAEGARLSSWRLQLNVAPEELDAVRSG